MATFSNASGSTIRLSSGLDDIGFDRDVNLLEVTAFGDDDREYIPGLKGAAVNFSGHFSSTHAKSLDTTLGHSTSSVCSLSPESTASGRRLFSYSAFLESLSYGTPVDGKVSMSGTFRITGAVTSTNH